MCPQLMLGVTSALLATILVMVSNTPLANSQERFHSKIMEAKDSRIKATAETLKCMRILKLHSWENAYLDNLLKLRDEERSWLRRYLYTCSAIAFLFWASPTLVSVVTFGVCILVKTPLTAGTVLSALATFRILQEPIYNLPELVSMITQTKVSIDRIQDFIKEEEHKPSRPNYIKQASDVAIEIEPGEYAWEADLSSKRPTLKIDQKITIMKGKKVAMCGSVGSGKSSFLCSIIGEIPRISGEGIEIFGSRAYVPQIAWIQTGTDDAKSPSSSVGEDGRPPRQNRLLHASGETDALLAGTPAKQVPGDRMLRWGPSDAQVSHSGPDVSLKKLGKRAGERGARRGRSLCERFWEEEFSVVGRNYPRGMHIFKN